MPDPDPDAGNIWLQLLLLLLLILCNAFFAASEMAIITLNDNQLRKMAEEGHKKARQVLRLTADSSRFLATIQIGVTLAGFLTSASAAQTLSGPLAAWTVARLPALRPFAGGVHTASLLLITLVVSYFSLVLGELAPKRIAMRRAQPIAFAAIGPLRVVAALARPFVRLLTVSTNAVVRLFGVNPGEHRLDVTMEEIRLLVDVGEEKGVIEESQRDMIDNIFAFADTTAADIMTPRTDVAALEVGDSVEDARALSVEKGYSRIPVYEEDIDHTLGVLFAKELLPYVGQLLPDGLSLRDFVRPAHYVPETKRCDELFAEMTERRLHLAVVVDEYGGMAGIVTMEDLLEAIVGNMQDEFDHEEEEITQIGENAFEVDGGADIEELGERLGVVFPEGEYDTLAGFLMDRLGRIPAGDEQPAITWGRLTLTVLEMEDRRIGTVRVELTPPPPRVEGQES